MTALPYLYRIDYQAPQTREKKTYRLSLQETSKKFSRHNSFPFDKHSTSNNANRAAEETNSLLPPQSREMSVCSWYNGESRPSRNTTCTIMSSCPSPSRRYHSPVQSKIIDPKLPVWVEAIGSWVPAKKKPHSYQNFIKHVKLAYRTRDMFMDPCPYRPRCKHARTLSALDRQRQRIKELEDMRHKERFFRLLERFGKIQEHWERISRQSDVIGAVHQARLNAFKKTIDHYKDPLDDIKKKRVEREKIERELQKQREVTRKTHRLDKMRRRIPLIIVTQYVDPADENSSEYESEESTGKEKIPIPVMPSWSDIENTIENNGGELDDMAAGKENECLKAAGFMSAESDSQGDSIEPELLNSDGVQAAGNVEESDGSTASLASNSSTQLAPPALSSLNPSDNNSLLDKITSADDTDILMSSMAPLPFGVANGVILDSAVTASSFLDRYHTPGQARLNNIKGERSKNAGTWCPKISDKKQFLQVDLGSTGTIKQIATQGYSAKGEVTKKDKRWVTSYSLAISEDGVKWTDYTENGAVKEFQGNRDNNSVVLNSLSQPVEARFVRILPRTWKNGIALRMEIFGNFPEEVVVTPIVDAFDVSGSGVSGESASLQSPPAPEPEEPLVTVEVSSEGLEQATAECKVNEELERTEVDGCDSWDEAVVDQVLDTAVEQETIEVEVMPLTGLTILGEQKSSRVRKPKKPKTEQKIKKEKKKKARKKITSVAISPELDELLEEPEEQPEAEVEQEPEEEPLFIVPPLPQMPLKDTKKKSVTSRKVSMFEAKNEPSSEPEESKKRRLSRATADDSIRRELRRQQLAEDRRKKFDDLLNDKSKGRTSMAPSLSPSYYRAASDMEQFITKCCILSEGQVNYYQRIFNTFDEDEDGILFPEEILDALEYVNSNLLSDSHLNYIFRILELCDCSLDSGADFKFFSVIVAFSQRIAALDEFAKILIPKLDFKELDYKLQRAKSLFMCYADEETKTMPMEHLLLELSAAGLPEAQRKNVLATLGQTTHLDFFDFLSYIPLFLHIHDNILNNPLGGVT